jgi:hypothetical protein
MNVGCRTDEPRHTTLGKLTKHNIVAATRLLSRELLAITCLISTVMVLLQHFSSVQLPFTYDSCYLCLMLLLVPLLYLESAYVQQRMALEAEDARTFKYDVDQRR